MEGVDSLGKLSNGLWKVSEGLKKVSDCLWKVLDGLRKVSYGPGKMLDGLKMMSDSLWCRMASGRCLIASKKVSDGYWKV